VSQNRVPLLEHSLEIEQPSPISSPHPAARLREKTATIPINERIAAGYYRAF